MNAASLMVFLVVVLAIALLFFAVVSAGNKKRGGGAGAGRRRLRGGSANALNSEQIADRWATIQAMAAGGGNGLRTAVSEADKLLDHAMRQSGIPGDTMGERLKRANGRFRDINAIWSAHKLRNALAHEVGFDLVPSQAREALMGFERGLRDLGALK